MFESHARLRWLGWHLLAAVLLAVAPIGAQLAAAASPASGSTPDFSGWWKADLQAKAPRAAAPADLPEGWRTMDGFHGSEPPVLTQWAYEETKKRRLIEEGATRAEGGADPQTSACKPAGFPDFMGFFDPVDIFQREDELLMVTERERTMPRHIYILPYHKISKIYGNGDILMPNGRSMAHWEGKVLIVDTTDITPEPWLFTFDRIPHSEQISVHERISLDETGNHLTDLLTITDPKTLVHPWTLRLLLNRAPPDTEALETACVPEEGQ
jgi:hypothetical protein